MFSPDYSKNFFVSAPEIEYFRSFSPPKAFGTSEGFCLFTVIMYLNISKRIRSNTLSPSITCKLVNNMG